MTARRPGLAALMRNCATEGSVLRVPTSSCMMSNVPLRSMISSRIFGRISESMICPLTRTSSEAMFKVVYYGMLYYCANER